MREALDKIEWKAVSTHCYRSPARAVLRTGSCGPDLVGVAGFEPTAPRSQSLSKVAGTV
jgi:hypothetical protein